MANYFEQRIIGYPTATYIHNVVVATNVKSELVSLPLQPSIRFVSRTVNKLRRSVFDSEKAWFKFGSIHKQVDLEHNFKVRLINELNLNIVKLGSIVREQVRIMSS